MKEIFKKATNSIICSSVLACIVGLIMVLNPNMSVKTIGTIVACYIIFQGIVFIFLDMKASRYFIPFDGILSGIVSIVLGILLISKPDMLSTILAIVVGVWISLASVNTIKLSLALKKYDTPWILLLLLGILDLISGIIVVLNPFEASISMTVLAGIMIMAHSIITIADMIVIKRDVKRISKAIETRIKEI